MSIEALVRWAGGGVFVGALFLCGYSFAVVWGRPAPFDGAAIAFDALLFTAFATHHSLFARGPVKPWLLRLVPERLLRSLYVWVASLLLILVCVAWQPVGGEVYRVAGAWRYTLMAVQIAGLLTIAGAVRAIDALELAGIRTHSGRDVLQISGPFRLVRHPLYFGWLLATFGPAHMTGDRLTFAVIAAIYLVLAVPFEERSLAASFGDDYRSYQRQVRWRMIPYIY